MAAVWLTLVAPRPTPNFHPSNPGDPNYHFGGLDALVREATAHGQHILLTILDAPTWAIVRTQGPAGFNGSPRSSAVGAFARALARRYSGRFPDPVHPRTKLPRIDYFQAWNEPNLPALIAPQWTRARHGWISASPAIYRNILNAVYANVKAVRPHAYVFAAGLAPYGDAPGRPYNRMHPITFLRDLLCLRGSRLQPTHCPHPAHFDALDVHPYSLTPTSNARNPEDVSMANIARLRRVLRAAQRTGRALPTGRKPIWVTEMGWSSRPPDPGGISLSRQASYVSLGFYELWRQGVDHIFWDLISDFPYRSLAGAGLYYQNGRAKPAAAAFRFPFVALRSPHGMVTLWGKAPRGGTVSIQRRRGHTWRRALLLGTTSGGVFHARPRLGSRLVLRAVAGRVTSLPWATG
jgi:hypothetical protein